MSDTLAGVERKQVWVWERKGAILSIEWIRKSRRITVCVKMYAWSACFPCVLQFNVKLLHVVLCFCCLVNTICKFPTHPFFIWSCQAEVLIRFFSTNGSKTFRKMRNIKNAISKNYNALCKLNSYLKVLSSEIDPAEIRLIRYAFLKGIVAWVF